MTPSETKRPLPSSMSTVFPSHPTTYAQWRIALGQVKLLFFKRQWKQCAAQCQKLLNDAKTPPHPVHASYLHFYCALSNELIARSTHNLSTAKLPLLTSAKDSYLAASASLPEPNPPQTDTHPAASPSSSSTFSSSRSSTPTPSNPSDHSAPSSPSPPPPSIDSTTSSEDETHDPSPLRAHKPPLLPPSKPSIPPPQSNTLPPLPSTSTSIHFSPSTTTWLHTRSQHRYTTHLLSFAAMLHNHITTITELIATTTQIQAIRYHAVPRLPSEGATEEARELDRKVRIERLRASGWVRERFCAERCEELCRRALAELGGG